jgi:hypothetical protein
MGALQEFVDRPLVVGVEASELKVDVVSAGVRARHPLTSGRDELQRRDDVPHVCFVVFAGVARIGSPVVVVREVPVLRMTQLTGESSAASASSGSARCV